MNFIDPVELRRFVESNPKLVNKKVSKRYPGLFVLKYNSRVFYDALWNESDFLLETRGLVVDDNYNIVVKPFTKLFNYGENGTTIDRDESVSAVVKINGFMGCATYRPDISDRLIVSTTGSLDSDFVTLAEKWIRPIEDHLKKVMPVGSTFIFEVCDESDKHIIPEKPGLYLIGANYASDNYIRQYTEGELDVFCRDLFTVKRPERIKSIRFGDLVKLTKTVKHEGFMVYGNTTRLKMKSPHYLTAKFLARCNSDKLLDRISANKREARKNIDEEYYDLLDNIVENLEEFKNMGEQVRLEYIRDFLHKDKT